MTGMVAGVDFIGLLLAERLRRERGAELSAGAASLGGRFGFVWCHTRFGPLQSSLGRSELGSQLCPSSPPPLRLLDTSLSGG